MAKLLMLLADGFDEAEAMSTLNILRRARIEVHTAGLAGTMVTSRNGVKMHADLRFIDLDVNKYDGLIIPGGAESTDTLMAHKTACNIIENFAKRGKVVAAINQAPKVLAKLGLLADKRATIASGMEKLLDRPRSDKVVVDGNIVTSQSINTAVDFGLKLTEMFAGKAAAARVRNEIA